MVTTIISAVKVMFEFYVFHIIFFKFPKYKKRSAVKEMLKEDLYVERNETQ